MSERSVQTHKPATEGESGLQQRIVAAEQERDQALAAAQAKASLLATVSHEIRTPIGAIISMADLLLDTELGATQRGYAETLRQSASGLLILLNDILDHSKLEAGQFTLVDVRFEPRSLLATITAAMTARAAGKAVEIVAEAAPEVRHEVVGDPDRIRQILLNIADNAVKFTDTGSVRISLAERPVDGGAVMLDFEVADTGIGMSDEMKARLFVPYSQAAQASPSRYGGTGLGLSIARRLVELMGGTIECESAPGAGTTFRFSVRCADAGDEARRIPETAAIERARTGSAHVLVVEDNKINQMLITTYLEKFGHSFEVASNGFEAIDLAATACFDVILMDVQMPEMDGIEATRRIRALGGAAAGQPIVALTANAMHGDRESYLAAGMNDYLAKPIIAANLLETLNRALGARPKKARRAG